MNKIDPKTLKKLVPTKRYIIVASLLLLFIIAIYFKKESVDNRIPILIKGKTVRVEVADTPKEQATGLMFRKRLEDDEGMLFVFDKQGRHSFWMKNTLIPLDMVWMDSKKEVVHIEHSAPPCKESPCPSYSSQYPAIYVLELNGGWAIENDLKLGDTLDF